MTRSTFYHAGCEVCLSAEHEIIGLLAAENVEVIHLGEDKAQVAKAEAAGVQSVPALLTPSGQVLHLNYGAAIAELK